MIDKVIDATGAEKIHYGGHSMGTTSFMVMANKKPEYQEKIILANLLAPIAFVDHMISPLKYIAPFAGSIDVSFSRKCGITSEDIFKLDPSSKNGPNDCPGTFYCMKLKSFGRVIWFIFLRMRPN